MSEGVVSKVNERADEIEKTNQTTHRSIQNVFEGKVYTLATVEKKKLSEMVSI